METILNFDLDNFNWEDILSFSQEFKKNPINPSVFEIEHKASIAVFQNKLTIYPPKRIVYNFVAEKLSIAVSKYYNTEATVLITETYTIEVSFADTSIRKTSHKGDILTFGQYLQKDGIISPIEWIILDETKEAYMLISKYALDVVGYCDSQYEYGNIESLIWENSFLKKWLNESFYQTAFTEVEQKEIVSKRIVTIDGKEEKFYLNNVYILSAEEVEKYLPSAAQRQAIPTSYAISKGARMGWSLETEKYTSWWLLPHVENTRGEPYRVDYPQAVFQGGEIQYHSRNIYHNDFTVRPAICLRKRRS